MHQLTQISLQLLAFCDILMLLLSSSPLILMSGKNHFPYWIWWCNSHLFQERRLTKDNPASVLGIGGVFWSARQRKNTGMYQGLFVSPFFNTERACALWGSGHVWPCMLHRHHSVGSAAVYEAPKFRRLSSFLSEIHSFCSAGIPKFVKQHQFPNINYFYVQLCHLNVTEFRLVNTTE